jgi:hypothetical protein
MERRPGARLLCRRLARQQGSESPSLRLVADVPVLAPNRPVKRIRTDLYAINKALS